MKPELNAVGSEVKLQLCSWHAAEAVKRRLIVEGYSSEMRSELTNLIWGWITSPTTEALSEKTQFDE